MAQERRFRTVCGHGEDHLYKPPAVRPGSVVQRLLARRHKVFRLKRLLRHELLELELEQLRENGL